MSATAIDKNEITSPAHHEVGELKKKAGLPACS